DIHPDDLPLLADHHDLVALGHFHGTDDRAVLRSDADVDDTAPPAALQTVLLHLRPLAVAALGHGQDVAASFEDLHLDEVVVADEADPPHAARRAAHRTDIRFAEPDALPLPRGDEDLLLARRHAHGEQVVPL